MIPRIYLEFSLLKNGSDAHVCIDEDEFANEESDVNESDAADFYVESEPTDESEEQDDFEGSAENERSEGSIESHRGENQMLVFDGEGFY